MNVQVELGLAFFFIPLKRMLLRTGHCRDDAHSHFGVINGAFFLFWLLCR